MRKILEQPTNKVLIGVAIFITLYMTVGNGLTNAIYQQNFELVLYSLSIWFIQTVWIVALMTLCYSMYRGILLVAKKFLNKKVTK